MYNALMDNSTEELIAQMDTNDATYGDRTYQEVVGLVRAKVFTIEEGGKRPVIKDKGKYIKGSGRPIKSIATQMQTTAATKEMNKHITQKFEELALPDLPFFYKQFKKACEGDKPDARLFMYYLDRILGKAREQKDISNITFAETYIESMSGSRPAKGQQPERGDTIVIDGETI